MNKRNTANRVDRLLDAAADLIARLGYDKTTISDIAAQAGVAKGAVYLHWNSKDALFEALITREMRRMLDDILARVEADPQGGSMARMYIHTILALQANSLVRALYTRDSRVLGDYIHRQDVSRYTSRIGMGAESIRAMQVAGLLRADLRPEAITFVFSIISIGMVGIGSILPEKDAPPLDEIGEALAAMIQGGIELPGGDNNEGKRTFIQMIDFMRKQYDESAGKTGSNQEV